MSIYATLGVIRLEPLADWPGCEHLEHWPEVYFQGVPGHIGHPDHYPEGDPYADFLPPFPPRFDPDSDLRAVVVVLRDHNEKDVQRYVRPLMTLSGREWETLPFPELWRRIEEAVREQLGGS